MNSMTGFGKAELTTRAGYFTVEISSVNSRFLEVSARLPRQFILWEHRLRELVSEKAARGKVSIYVGFEEREDAPGRYRLNDTALKKYYRQLVRLKRELKLTGDIRVADLVPLPDVALTDETAESDDLIWSGVKRATQKALAELLVMRRREGRAMAQDMNRRLKTVARLTQTIKRLSPVVVEKYRERLSARINELVESGAGDEGRLEQEIALFAEKSDISEECTRLVSHVDQFRKALRVREPVGKRLNFILQEMNREANTMSSKSPDAKVTGAVIALKEEIEKLREQVQNVE
ncbi:MAG: YicC/YloC family endoribonuclease [Candidatus Zixiibacteriota bacterium]